MKKFIKEMPLYWWALVVMVAMLVLLLWMEMLHSVTFPTWITTATQLIGGAAGMLACVALWPHCPEWYHKGSAIGAAFVLAYTLLLCAIANIMGVPAREFPVATSIPSSVAVVVFLVSTFVMCSKNN